MKLNFLIEHEIPAKPKKANLEPPAPVSVICDLVNLLLVFILSLKDFEMQLHEAPESIFARKLYPLLFIL